MVAENGHPQRWPGPIGGGKLGQSRRTGHPGRGVLKRGGLQNSQEYSTGRAKEAAGKAARARG